MDKLDVIKKMEAEGGMERRRGLEDLIRQARKLGCSIEIGGGRVGGINLRYGSIGFAIMDVNCHGEVKLYVQPHPSRPAPAELRDALNDFIGERKTELEPKTHPINSYSLLQKKLEEIESDALHAYLEEAIERIRGTYYVRRSIL